MADSLTNIQTDARFWANDGQLDIISDSAGLRLFNMAYQGLCTPDFKLLGVSIGRRWPETTREDTSLTMVVSQEQYTWPTSPVFVDPTWIEGLDTNNSNAPYPIHWAPDMTTWSLYDEVGDAEPLYCRLIDVSGTLKLALRPTPVRTDGIRITGLIQITELTVGANTTIFRNYNTDKALSILVAALYKMKRGEPEKAIELLTQVKGLLPVNDTTPGLTGSGVISPWQYGGNATRGWR